MELERYVEGVRRSLEVAGEVAGPEGRELAARLAAPLESALRLALLEALSAAASEITLELAPTSVEVRLRGRDPEFVTAQHLDQAYDDAPAEPRSTSPATPETDEGGMSRTTLRLPDHLKQRVEEAAGRQGLSVNSWLIQAVTDALESDRGARRAPRRGSDEQRYTGWAR
jgi:hypothetical protein